MRVRMKDIARRVGVSQATVSQVLAGRVSEFRISTETAAYTLSLHDALPI